MELTLWERRQVIAQPSGGKETRATEALFLKNRVVTRGRSWILSQGILFGGVEGREGDRKVEDGEQPTSGSARSPPLKV